MCPCNVCVTVNVCTSLIVVSISIQILEINDGNCIKKELNQVQYMYSVVMSMLS